jgi:hypothetical protein
VKSIDLRIGDQAMSLWLRRKDPDGTTHYVALGVIHLILPAFAILGVLIAVILSLIRACR